MKFLSLFSGIGGFDLAFENAGMQCVSVCEIDKNAQSVLRRHFPNASLFQDVRKVGINTHGRKSIDLICGGFPCQDVSIAGKRKGIAGERSGLWFEFARIIDELEPQWVVIENVPGLLSSNKGKDFAVIVHWLAERGYGVTWRVFDAQHFGVPQRRRRVFIVGCLGNGSAAEVLFESESSSGNITAGEQTGQTDPRFIAFEPGNLRRQSGSKPNLNTFPTLGAEKQGDTFPHVSIANTLTSEEFNRSPRGDGYDNLISIIEQNNMVSTPDMISLRANPAMPLISFDANQNLRDVSFDIAPTLTHNGDGKKAHNAYAKISIMAHGQANAEIVNDGEPSLTTNHEAPIVWHNKQSAGEIRVQDDISPTVSRQWGTGGNNVPFVGARRLMPVECERLQGFPDGWTAGQSDSARYRQLGNAVAVPVVEWIGKRIMKVWESQKLHHA